MTKTYDSAMIAITEIDGVLRDKMVKRNSGDTVRIILLFVVLCFSGFVNASVDTAKSQQGDSSETAAAAYAKGDYQQAAECYTKLLKVGESAELYYNLGNCEYRLGNITQSIIAYERALRLNPGDSDTRYNLQFLRGKTIDKVVPVDEMFFVTWYHSLQNLMSIDAWAILAVSAFVLALILILAYLFGSNILLRKIGFFGALVGLLILC